MIESIKEIIREQLDVSDIEINEGTRIIEDLGADSLDVVEILTEVEDRFEISIPRDYMAKLHTIGEIKEYIDRIKNGQ